MTKTKKKKNTNNFELFEKPNTLFILCFAFLFPQGVDLLRYKAQAFDLQQLYDEYYTSTPTQQEEEEEEPSLTQTNQIIDEINLEFSLEEEKKEDMDDTILNMQSEMQEM